MEFLINESQLKLILQEQDQSKMSDYMKELYSFTSNIINKVRKTYGLNLKLLLTWGASVGGLNLKLLLTWGASVGGLVMPLDNFIRSGRFDITDEQVALLLVGVACTYFYDNENALKKILSKIKEEGLEDIFKEVLLKGKNLKDSFTKFIKSSKVTINSTLDIITYAFLIPIITDIQSLITSGEDIQTVSMKVAKRLVASGVVLVGQVVLTEIIKKIIKKLS
jgi:hypothetical protein